jgi:Winged helix-turn helix
MSTREFGRLEVLLGVRSGRLRISDACALLGLRRRQVFRLLRGLRRDGAASLVSKRRGRPSNRRLPGEVRDLALALVPERHADFVTPRAATACPARRTRTQVESRRIAALRMPPAGTGTVGTRLDCTNS